MDIEDIKKVGLAYLQVLEAKNKKEEKLDPVDPKALKKDFDDREDKDIDNDGDVDSSDEYLHKRRQAITKAMKKETSEARKCAKESVNLDESWTTVHDSGKTTSLNKNYVGKGNTEYHAFHYKDAKSDKPHKTEFLGTSHDEAMKKYKDILKKKGEMKEEVELDERYTRSIGFKQASDMVYRLGKILQPNSALAKGISRDADNVTPEFKKMQKHMQEIQKLWDEVERTIDMSESFELDEAKQGPSDETRDTWEKQLSTRKGEKDFVDMHDVETPEFTDANKVIPQTFKSMTQKINKPNKRWNDQHVGDKKPVPNDGK